MIILTIIYIFFRVNILQNNQKNNCLYSLGYIHKYHLTVAMTMTGGCRKLLITKLLLYMTKLLRH